MNISLDDFNALSAERSNREVRIAQLKMELMQAQREHAMEVGQMKTERDALWEENSRLKHRLELLETDFENVRFENHWMRQYILLSMEKVRALFSHMHDIKMLSAVKAFILDMMPSDATPEQVALASNAMMLPMDEPTVPVTHNHYEAGSTAQVFNGEVSGSTFNPPQ